MVKKCIRYAVVNEYCKQHAKFCGIEIPKVPSKNTIANYNGEYHTCNCKKHHINGSDYDREKVPIILFKNNKSNELYNYCLDCREYNMKGNNKLFETRRILACEQRNTSTDFLYCPDKIHDTSSESIYDRDKVPVELFRKVPDDPKSELFESCKNCR